MASPHSMNTGRRVASVPPASADPKYATWGSDGGAAIAGRSGSARGAPSALGPAQSTATSASKTSPVRTADHGAFRGREDFGDGAARFHVERTGPRGTPRRHTSAARTPEARFEQCGTVDREAGTTRTAASSMGQSLGRLSVTAQRTRRRRRSRRPGRSSVVRSRRAGCARRSSRGSRQRVSGRDRHLDVSGGSR